MLSKPNPRIEPGVAEVDDDIDHQDKDGRIDVDAGNDGIVPNLNRIDDQPADAGQAEDVFHYHRPTNQDRELQTDHGDHRDQRILQHVPRHHHPFPEALGPSSPDVVRSEHFQHRVAHQAHGHPGKPHPQDESRNDHHGQVVQGVVQKRHIEHRG